MTLPTIIRVNGVIYSGKDSEAVSEHKVSEDKFKALVTYGKRDDRQCWTCVHQCHDGLCYHPALFRVMATDRLCGCDAHVERSQTVEDILSDLRADTGDNYERLISDMEEAGPICRIFAARLKALMEADIRDAMRGDE